MHEVLHPRADVDRLYVSRKKVRTDTRPEDYIEKYEGVLFTATRNDTNNMLNNRMTITRKQKWEEKKFMGVLND